MPRSELSRAFRKVWPRSRLVRRYRKRERLHWRRPGRGYNQQFANFVAGLRPGIQGIAGVERQHWFRYDNRVVVGVPVTSTQTATMETKYLGTVRGRLGFLTTPTCLYTAPVD